MRSFAILTLTAATLGALTACGSNQTGQDFNAVHSPGLAKGPLAPTTTTSSRKVPEKSPRGNIVKKVGEVAGGCADDNCNEVAITFTVDKIEVDPQCTGKLAKQVGARPENGHFVAMSFTVKTTDKFVGDSTLFTLNPYNFAVVGPDGITEANSPGSGAYSCLPESEMLPSSTYAPSSQYVGKILIDTKHKTGIITLRPPGLEGGWEWQF